MVQHSNQLNRTNEDGFYNTLKELTEKVVGRYIARSVIPKREQEDVETAIIEKFLLKQDKIDSAFQGKSKRTTYYIAVLNRMCAEIIRKEQKHWYAVKEMADKYVRQDAPTFSYEAAKHTLVKDELKRLKVALMLFGSMHAKVLLFLKYWYNIPLGRNDVEDYAGKLVKEAMEMLEGRDDLSKTQIHERLADLLALVEKKDISGDAVRMWLNKQMNMILYRLNGENEHFHTKETIGLMLEMLEDREKQHNIFRMP